MTIAYELPSLVIQPAEPEEMPAPVLCTAETAECSCPDFCERDHDND
jgi:hypothetical protein